MSRRRKTTKSLAVLNSFVPGAAPAWYLQFYGQSTPQPVDEVRSILIRTANVDEAPLNTCFPCHQKIEARDFVFTHYAPVMLALTAVRRNHEHRTHHLSHAARTGTPR